MSDKHVIQSTDGKEIFAPLHQELVVTTRISWFEEERTEIPSKYTDTWMENNYDNIPDSDAIKVLAELEGRASDSQKRGTSDISQASTVSRQPSPSKKHR